MQLTCACSKHCLYESMKSWKKMATELTTPLLPLVAEVNSGSNRHWEMTPRSEILARMRTNISRISARFFTRLLSGRLSVTSRTSDVNSSTASLSQNNTLLSLQKTSRERPKSAPYLRLKNSKRTSKCQVL